MKYDKRKILHIAQLNTAGVPYTFMSAERQLGFDSHLVTFHRHPHNYPEDICLQLPFFTFSGMNALKKIVNAKHKNSSQNHEFNIETTEIPPKWTPSNSVEKSLIKFREMLWRRKISKFVEDIDLPSFDIIQLDGGLGFFRDGRIIKSLKEQGVTIVCCYTGSDLRLRGVIPSINEVSDLNITVEFDHINLHPDIHHVFFPFEWDKMPLKQEKPKDDKLIIGHAPTNRATKGSDIIIPLLYDLQKQFAIEILLIENVSYHDALALKSRCDIFIDQIGNLGYGINSLEALAMEIPACSCLAPGFEELYPDHPFVIINESNFKHEVARLIRDDQLRLQKGAAGKKWIVKNHDSIHVVKKIHTLINTHCKK